MAKTKKIKSPTQLELVEPTFSALVELGGSATVDEIREKVINDVLQIRNGKISRSARYEG